SRSAPIRAGQDELFVKPSLDIDVLVVPMKYRSAVLDIPRQLNADFNGNIFLGYRIDRFRSHFKKTPAGFSHTTRHRALSVGVFGGLGATDINPTTTSYQTTDEYKGLVLSRGFALMFGVNNLTVGVGLGWDALTDRDKNIWAYQNKSWL